MHRSYFSPGTALDSCELSHVPIKTHCVLRAGSPRGVTAHCLSGVTNEGFMCQEHRPRAANVTQHWGFHKLCINTSSGRANANHISTDLSPNNRDLALGKQLGERHRPKGLRVSHQGTKGGNRRFNVGIDPGEKSQQERAQRQAKRKFTLDSIL